MIGATETGVKLETYLDVWFTGTE